ncbi:PaaI family thioesterase [Aquabacterium sp. J223]|uniref:PaaI family thioesterase n=1 Tax=Aquabacterium sp. J223 TaxID=2898431 RepID=UPI0021AE1A91|nr:PaaI family thioesterase [Aquabacterium sp. J223]UUX97257.1 PaaI family thioesterase [Aquabacterium sp. J223]
MDFPTRIPFVELLGLSLEHFEVDTARLALTLRDELGNSLGMAHGGVTMTLLDVAMAHAARSPTTEGGERTPAVVTIEMKTTFMRPGTGRLVAEGRRLHRTASMAFCEAAVRDDHGRLVAHATGTFKYMKTATVGGRRIDPPVGGD